MSDILKRRMCEYVNEFYSDWTLLQKRRLVQAMIQLGINDPNLWSHEKDLLTLANKAILIMESRV